MEADTAKKKTFTTEVTGNSIIFSPVTSVSSATAPALLSAIAPALLYHRHP